MTIPKHFFFYVLALFMVISVAAAPACAMTTSPESPLIQPEPPTSPPEQVPTEIELKYDDYSAEDCLAHGNGYLIDFTPPSTPFTINKVRTFGYIAGEATAPDFSIEIWDKNYKVLFTYTYPVTIFPEGSGSWVDIEVPGIEVNGTFYVNVFTGTPRLKGIHIGADDSILNLHSGITSKMDMTSRIYTGWPYPADKWFGDISKVNWMIRAAGTSPGTTAPSTDGQEQPSNSIIRIETANGSERELKTKALLEKLVTQYDVSKWLFTETVMIEAGSIPHSHPTLTLNDRYVSCENMLLSNYLHEQIHWFLVTREAQTNKAISEFKKVYPDFPVDTNGVLSARTEYSVYLHFIVNYLELSAMTELMGEEAARLAIGHMGHYILLYEKVLSDTDTIGEIVKKHGLIIE